MPQVATRKRHIIPISGKDSLCTAIVQTAREPNLPYEYLFCDVRMELPETYAWLDAMERQLGFKLVRIGKSLENVIAEKGMLPSHQRRFCTKSCKIFPIQEFVGSTLTVQYIGIRADEEQRLVGAFERKETEMRYPLIEMGITLPMVYKLLDDRKLLPPSFFWQRLWDEVWERCNRLSRSWLETISPWTKASLFSWRSRGNCFMCFYQRLYEWVGLLEHHPELFEKAERLEYDWGSVAGPNRSALQNNFYWRQGEPLLDVRARADSIFNKRVKAVWGAVTKGRQNAEDEDLDLLQLTSCGIYCGK